MATYYVLVLLVLSICLISGKAFVVGTTKANLPSNCTLRDDSTCPKGYCCARDPFLFTETQCKSFGKERDSCTTRLTAYECPCSPHLECKPNIIGTGRPSLFGTCKPIPGLNITTTPLMTSSGGARATSVSTKVPAGMPTKISNKSTLLPSKQLNTDNTTTSLPRRNSTTSASLRTDKFYDPFVG